MSLRPLAFAFLLPFGQSRRQGGLRSEREGPRSFGAAPIRPLNPLASAHGLRPYFSFARAISDRVC
jgi:hypothetical protein